MMHWRFTFEGGPFDGFAPRIDLEALAPREKPPGEIWLDHGTDVDVDMYWPGAEELRRPTAERYLRASFRHPNALYRWADLPEPASPYEREEAGRELVPA